MLRGSGGERCEEGEGLRGVAGLTRNGSPIAHSQAKQKGITEQFFWDAAQGMWEYPDRHSRTHPLVRLIMTDIAGFTH